MERKIVDTYACGHSVERDSEDVIAQLFGFVGDQPEHIDRPCCVCLAAEARLARQNRINAYVEAEQLKIPSLCGDINKDFGAMLKKLNKPYTSQEINSHRYCLTVYHYTGATGAKITAVERFVDSFSWPFMNTAPSKMSQ